MSFITEYADAVWSMTYDVGQIAKVVFAWGLTFLAVFFVGDILWAICSIIKDKFTRMKTLKTSSEYCRKHDKPSQMTSSVASFNRKARDSIKVLEKIIDET